MAGYGFTEQAVIPVKAVNAAGNQRKNDAGCKTALSYREFSENGLRNNNLLSFGLRIFLLSEIFGLSVFGINSFLLRLRVFFCNRSGNRSTAVGAETLTFFKGSTAIKTK